MDPFYHRVRRVYQSTAGDATDLFRTILLIAGEIGLNEALSLLERCVTEKRIAWLQRHEPQFENTDCPLPDAYRLFYEDYLGLSVPNDGEIVEWTANRVLMRWWNPCPTLEACVRLGLDTRGICREVYHRPVQELLSALNPALRFGRNYDALRPYVPYCEEYLLLEDNHRDAQSRQ